MNADQNTFVSKSELISTFSVIDTRITELHQCSAKDFSHLSNYLKAYHNKTSIISENAFRIFHMLGGDEGNQFLGKLEDILAKIKDCQNKIEQKSNENILIIEKILARTILLTVALKNFRQDLTTFKFLATNYKLLANYENFDVDWNAAVVVWEKLVRMIRSSLPVITDGLEKFKNQLYACIDMSKSNLERSSLNFKQLTVEIEACINLVSQKNQESDLHIPVLKQKIENSSKSIENIITHLQYQDIIKQKIDHIKKSHLQILDDLKDPGQKDGCEKDESNTFGKFNRIGDIAGLQTSQLMLVNKEYQLAIEVITRSFHQIGNDLSSISNISQQFFSDGKKSEITLIQQVKDKLDRGIIILDLNNLNELSNNFQDIISKHKHILQDAKDISNPLDKVTKLDLFEHNEKAVKPGSDYTQPKIFTQITSIVNEIKTKTANIFKSINEIFELSDNMSSADASDEWGSQLEQDQIKLMVDISKILDSLDKENQSLDTILKQNKQLSEEILDNIKSTINRVDYYDFFDKIIEEVIQKLNAVNFRLKPLGQDVKKSDKIKNLKDLKKMYTMASERVIHQRAEQSDEESPGDIEFFTPVDEDESIELF